jgi:hypothetical protein
MRGYMAIPLPYASALGEAGLRVAALGESTARFCACHGPSCNAPTGLNETINLYDRATTYRLLPGATGWYPFPQLRAPKRLIAQPFDPSATFWLGPFAVRPVHARSDIAVNCGRQLHFATDSDSAGSTILGYTHLPPAPSAPPWHHRTHGEEVSVPAPWGWEDPAPLQALAFLVFWTVCYCWRERSRRRSVKEIENSGTTSA